MAQYNEIWIVCLRATDEDFYSSLAQMAGEGFDDDDDDDDEVMKGSHVLTENFFNLQFFCLLSLITL